MISAFEKAGFEVHHTGGNLTAWKLDLGNDVYILVTDADDGSTHEVDADAPHLVGVHSVDGEQDGSISTRAVNAAMAIEQAKLYARQYGPARFHFCIVRNVPGCLPNSREYHSANTEAECESIISAAIDEFAKERPYGESNWGAFLGRGVHAPDASMWHFTLAEYDDESEVLDLVGMTYDDWRRESEE